MPGKSGMFRWVFFFDALAGAFAISVASLLVRHYEALTAYKSGRLTALDVLFYLSFVLLTLTIIVMGGDYVPQKRYSRLSDAALVVRGAVLAFMLLVSSSFVLEDFLLPQSEEFSRPGILILVAIFVSLLLAVRMAAHSVQARVFGSGGWRKKMVIVGAGSEGIEVYEHLKAKDWLGVNCVGFVDETATASPFPGVPILGRVGDLQSVVAEQGVEEVVIALPPTEHELMEDIVNNGIRQNVKLRIIPDSFAYPYSKLDIQEYDGLAIIDVKQPQLDVMHSGLKRFIDIVAASILLLFDSVFMLIIPLVIKLTSKGPAFYRQTRLGKEGRSFEILKFRSMVEGAHQLRKRMADKNEASGPIFKMKEDPRVTRFGRLLRRTSLDELPQLINVLKGDMSMVGPRPPLPEEVGRYRAQHMKRLSVRPGVTGLWQVSGRDRRDFDEMAKLDFYYIENWSIRLDLKIILKTVPTVLFRRGAY